ncbi:hypothetical protein CC78DRAFT_469398 [Lojkania enalia]|uniref:Uncharacterized protein n=1 Tax=Lojkania enalia TaxID=147567 RepID=A0A9P4N1P1_9PLEO|nr:hypothetical protein CC78DRAFT_469398 [Didymosphaeria enalia]
MKINPAPFRLAQTVVIGLALALSIAVLGTAAHTLAVFNKQQTVNPWWLYFWPQHYNVSGTKALIGSAAAVTVLSIIYLVFALVPQAVQRHTARALVALATILPSLLVTLITVIFAHILNNNAPEYDTIQTWTCRYKDSRPLQRGLPTDMGNDNFGQLCMESRFSVYGTLTVFLLLGIGMVMSIVTWVAEKWEARRVRKEGEIDGMQS